MKQRFQRMLSLLLCLAMCFSALPAAAFAEGETIGTESTAEPCTHENASYTLQESSWSEDTKDNLDGTHTGMCSMVMVLLCPDCGETLSEFIGEPELTTGEHLWDEAACIACGAARPAVEAEVSPTDSESDPVKEAESAAPEQAEDEATGVKAPSGDPEEAAEAQTSVVEEPSEEASAEGEESLVVDEELASVEDTDVSEKPVEEITCEAVEDTVLLDAGSCSHANKTFHSTGWYRDPYSIAGYEGDIGGHSCTITPVKYYLCSDCGSFVREAIGASQSVYESHEWDDYVCLACGITTTCMHPNAKTLSDSFIPQIETCVDNGDGTHRGEYIRTCSYSCPDCRYSWAVMLREFRTENRAHAWDMGECVHCGATIDVEITAPETLLAGKSARLTAMVPGEDGFINWKWSIVSGAQYASITSSGTLKAKTVSEPRTVKACVRCPMDIYAPAYVSITIMPAASSVSISRNGRAVTGQTISYNLRSGTSPISLTAKTLPIEAPKEVNWSVSDKKQALASSTITEEGLTLIPSGNPGTVTITAAAMDGSKKKASVTISFVNQLLPGELVITGLPEAPLQGKQTMALKTNLAELPGVSDKKLLWSLSEDSLPFASITGAGKLTVKEVGEEVSITVIATSSVNPSATAQAVISLTPVAEKQATTEVRLFDEKEQVLNSRTVTLDIGQQGSPLTLSAKAYSAEPVDIIWKSSNAKIAAVETTADGSAVITGIKPGTVTITATATDGSKISGAVKITVKKAVYSLQVAAGSNSVTAGKSLALKAYFGEETPTNTKVTWSLRPEDAPYATISAKGVLKASKLTGQHTVQVTVTSAENQEKSDSIYVTIYPSATAVKVLWNDSEVSGAKLPIDLSELPEKDGLRYLVLSAEAAPSDARSDISWKTSSAKLATVDAAGTVTFTGVAGTVKITATAADGSGKKAVVTIVITQY